MDTARQIKSIAGLSARGLFRLVVFWVGLLLSFVVVKPVIEAVEVPRIHSYSVTSSSGVPVVFFFVRCGAAEGPQFEISQVEVTQHQFFALMQDWPPQRLEAILKELLAAQKYSALLSPEVPTVYSPDSSAPIILVSLEAAVAFCERLENALNSSNVSLYQLRVRLPSVAEWQAAGRAGGDQRLQFDPWPKRVKVNTTKLVGDHQDGDKNAGEGKKQPAEEPDFYVALKAKLLDVAADGGPEIHPDAELLADFVDKYIKKRADKSADLKKAMDEILRQIFTDDNGLRLNVDSGGTVLTSGRGSERTTKQSAAVFAPIMFAQTSAEGTTTKNQWGIWDLHGGVREVAFAVPPTSSPDVEGVWDYLCHLKGQPEGATVQVHVVGGGIGQYVDTSTWQYFSFAKSEPLVVSADTPSLEKQLADRLVGLRLIIVPRDFKPGWLAKARDLAEGDVVNQNNISSLKSMYDEARRQHQLGIRTQLTLGLYLGNLYMRNRQPKEARAIYAELDAEMTTHSPKGGADSSEIETLEDDREFVKQLDSLLDADAEESTGNET